MQKRLTLFFCSLLVLSWGITNSFQGSFWVRAQQPTSLALQATPTLDRLAIPELPENPTPIELGRYSYYYNCMPCHGDRGQGLTDEWRLAWVDDHQNCWERGCHAGRAGDEGFPIPTTIPPVMGDSILLQNFATIQDLTAYLQLTHPPQHPGKLPAEEYQALAIYLWGEITPTLTIKETASSPAKSPVKIPTISVLILLGWMSFLFLGIWIHERFISRA